MDHVKLKYLTGKYFNNTISEDELQELCHLVGIPAHQPLLGKVLEEVWQSYEPERQMPENMSQNILQQLFPARGGTVPPLNTNTADALLVKPAAHPKVRRMPVWKYFAVAASVFLLFTLAWWLMPGQPTAPADNTKIVSAKKGSRLKAMLPDGTVVWLNAGSKLAYNNEFGRSTRSVSLTGEAFFDVTHDKSRPFLIHTTAMDLKVLGTTFNVRAYPDEQLTEACLITGMLEVSFGNSDSGTIILKPSEKISINNQSDSTNAFHFEKVTAGKTTTAVSSVTYQPGDSSVVETSWINNKLVFRNKPFEEIAVELSRWYNVTFDVQDKTLLTKRFTATFETETIFDVLNRLSASYHFSFVYNKEKNTFTIGK